MLRMQNIEKDYSNKEIFIGIDVHKKSFKICLICEGIEIKPLMTNSNPEELIRYLENNFPHGNYHSAYEAGYSGYWIHEKLSKAGIDSIIVHPPDIPINQRDREQKTDQRDSRKIARMLSAGQLSGIYIPEKEIQEHRQFIRYRQKLVRDRTRLKNKIKGALSFIGYSIDEQSTKSWTKKFLMEIKSIKYTTEYGKQALDQLIKQYEWLSAEVKQYDKQIKKMSELPRYKIEVSLLRTIPGISILSAMILLTEIVDIRRFNTLEDLVSYFGLLPTEYSSGDRQKNGRMSKRGNKNLKYIITEISWTAITKDPELSRCYMEYKNRMVAQKAIIKIARKVLSRIKHILETHEEYIIGRSKIIKS